MLFAESDYSSSDDAPIISIAPKIKKLPENLTIDALFESRKNEIKAPPSQAVKKETNTIDTPQINLTKQKIDLKDYIVPELKVINESIFNQTHIPFPISVFSFLKTDIDYNQHFSIIPFDQIHYLSFFDPLLIEITEQNVYFILYSLLCTQDERYGMLLLKLINQIPKLNFSIFMYFFKKIIDLGNSSLFIYPAILCNISHFRPTQMIQDDLFILYISMIICSSISKHQYFYIVTDNFQLSNPSYSLIQDIRSLVLESHIQGIGNLVVYLNITKNTAQFFIILYMSLINSLFNVETSFPKTFQGVLDSLILLIPKLKDLIDSNDENQILRSSAILSLMEQIIVSAKLLNFITIEQASLLCKALKFNLMGENGTYLFLLKEQLHITLTQIEYIADATLCEDDNPFFH